MIKDYMKKQVVIQALKWTGENVRELEEFTKDTDDEIWYRDNDDTGELYINTLEGEMKANCGDYIIKGVKGEFYPCKPDIFEMSYNDISIQEDRPANDDWKKNRDFGWALDRMKHGFRVARNGWNGKGMYIWLVGYARVEKSWVKDAGLLEAIGDRDSIECLGFIRMKTADGKILSGWLASQTDMLANDWEIVEL